MKVLLTWELGLNLGHLTRLHPLANKLKLEGNAVLVAVRNVAAAAPVLGPDGISFIQAPHLSRTIDLNRRTTGYADILRAHGWSDRSALWALIQSWLSVFRLFRPDKLILDYSPTASLAARIANIPAVLIGNGFELPPLYDPLPPFPSLAWATPEKASQAEINAVSTANDVLRAFKSPPILALRDLFEANTLLFTTFPELDHYGSREGAIYVGPLLRELTQPRLPWPEGDGPKIFACLKPNTSRVNELLTTFTKLTARVLCVASGFKTLQLAPYMAHHIRFTTQPINLRELYDADVCITYGAEGTMLRFLLAGVPQLIVPWHVEAFMAATKIETLGLGAIVKTPGDSHIRDSIETLLSDVSTKDRASVFAKRHQLSDTAITTNTILKYLYNSTGKNNSMPVVA